VSSIRVVAPAKINLSLRIRGVRGDGYHEISTVFHAVSLVDEVTVSTASVGAGRSVSISGEGAATVPSGDDNIVAQAALALARASGLPDPDVSLAITKSIPVAAGMAGGSADAAAALVGLRRLWNLDLDDAALRSIAAGIGSDVPFALLGGNARGVGRGEILTPVLSEGSLHWVVALSHAQLSTPHVYAEWDRLRAEGKVPLSPADDGADAPLLTALRRGDPRAVAAHLVNDLEPAAVTLQPSLASVLETGRELGALAGIVSGSGPTCVFLVDDRERAINLAAELAGTGTVRGVRAATGPAPGARIVT
jgi:4-diphosphocytidyl-2-C-methyl-D-erythritol kinase